MSVFNPRAFNPRAFNTDEYVAIHRRLEKKRHRTRLQRDDEDILRLLPMLLTTLLKDNDHA